MVGPLKSATGTLQEIPVLSNSSDETYEFANGLNAHTEASNIDASRRTGNKDKIRFVVTQNDHEYYLVQFVYSYDTIL